MIAEAEAQVDGCVVVFFGMTASGKSYLAGGWTRDRNITYLNSDIIRKQLAGLQPEKRQLEPIGGGIYSAEFSRKTYDAMLNQAYRASVEKRETIVVVDGSYGDGAERRRVLEMFSSKRRVLFVHCYCSEAIALQRMAIRKTDNHAVSDGRLLIYKHQQEHFVMPDELSPKQLLSLDTDATLDDLIGEVENKLKEIC